MCFHTVRALSSWEGGEMSGLGAGVGVLAVGDLGCGRAWLGIGALFSAFDDSVLVGSTVVEGNPEFTGTVWSLGTLPGVAVGSSETSERVECCERDAVSDSDEQGPVLNCSEAAGDATLESASSDVSEMRIEGLSSRERELWARIWFSSAVQMRFTGGSSDAVSPRW